MTLMELLYAWNLVLLVSVPISLAWHRHITLVERRLEEIELIDLSHYIRARSIGWQIGNAVYCMARIPPPARQELPVMRVVTMPALGA